MADEELDDKDLKIKALEAKKEQQKRKDGIKCQNCFPKFLKQSH